MNIVTPPLPQVFVLDAQLADIEILMLLLKLMLVQIVKLVQTV
jgi:hypothetical protein